MTRTEHLDWSKKRALKLLEAGDIRGAYTSMCSDMSKHAETEGHSAINLGMILMLGGHLNSQDKMRNFIEGFN
jgi:hypothetical protein